jgi:DNA polymerase-3 subunit epsilon/ATP-dependent DNA helicase DinG
MRRQRQQLEGILGAGGLLAKVVEGYDPRPQQLELGTAVLEALVHERVLLAEAPTGVGKTLAYLVPAALHARAQHEPVVISSYTRALQDQILLLEAPRLKRLVHPDLAVVALKGRGNYLCRRRWELFLAEEASGSEGRRVVDLLEKWVFATETGDFAQAPDLGPRAVWAQRRIGGDARFCRGRECRPENGCFHKLARRTARDAHLIVINHALLIADAAGGGILPEHRALIVDEAHLLPDAALDQLSRRVSQRGLLDRIRLMGGAGEPGVSDRLRRAAQLLPSRVAARNLSGRAREIEALTQPALAAARELAAALCALPAFPPPGARVRYGAETDTLVTAPPALDALLATVEPLVRAARALGEAIGAEQPSGEVARGRREAGADAAELLEAADAWIEELETEIDTLEQLLTPEPRRFVYCLEHDERDGVGLAAVPLETGPSIRELILDRHACVVMTSATLGIGEGFDHFAGQVGLQPNEALSVRLPSPFALEQQLLTLVPVYGVDPRRSGYVDSLAGALAELAPEVPHKMLALFTAYETLERVAAALRARDLGGIELLAQSRDAGRAQLIERFRAAPRALLLGTASFWYGVDFPGEELELLAVTRLPFPVPTDPRAQAIAELLAESGRSGFEDYALPEAILRFRQGLGRLIRRRSDRGVCVVLDPRIESAAYGKRFQAVLPAAPVRVANAVELRVRVREWFAAAQPTGGST